MDIGTSLLSVFQSVIRMQGIKGVRIFIDNSNIWIGAKENASVKKGFIEGKVIVS